MAGDWCAQKCTHIRFATQAQHRGRSVVERAYMRLFGRKSGGGVRLGSDRVIADVGSANVFRSLQDTTTGLTRLAFKVRCYPRKMSVRVARDSVSLKTKMSEKAFDYIPTPLVTTSTMLTQCCKLWRWSVVRPDYPVSISVCRAIDWPCPALMPQGLRQKGYDKRDNVKIRQLSRRLFCGYSASLAGAICRLREFMV
jgi:hypothetical protein